MAVRTVALSVLALPMLLLTACGAGEPSAAGVSTGATDAPPPDAAQLYEADATVLEQGEVGDRGAHGPELCLGGMTASLPPQCGGPPIANWDWDAVEGEETLSGTTWGAYHLVGTYADGVFTVTQIGPHDPDGETFGTNPDFTPPCPEPDGGWVDVDPAMASERDFERGAALAGRLPDFVALWVEYVGDPSPDEMEQLEAEGNLPQTIMNVVVTGAAAAAEAAIRTAWGGPLCVVQRGEHNEQELKAIRHEAERWLEEELGLQMTWSLEGPLGEGAAEVGVVVDPGGAGQAALDERYGPAMVRLFPAFRPVE